MKALLVPAAIRGEPMSQDRLSPLDASFLHIEDGDWPMHVACVMTFAGDPPPYDSLVEHIESRLALVPRYRQRLAWVPFGQGRPKWVDDEHFDIRYHVRVTALPRPGGEEELKTLAGRIFSIQLNREKPLWETWLVEGLSGGRFALLSKTHHALVDGISGLDILSVLFAPEDGDNAERSHAWRPQRAPSGVALLSEALLERAVAPREVLRPLRALFRRPRQLATRAFELAVGFGTLAWAGLAPAPRTPYNEQAVGSNRRFTWVRADLDTVKAIKDELGGTVNDVILTIVTRGLREHLIGRGEDVDDLTLKAFVPVSVRTDEQRGGETLGNKVSGMIAPLPVGCPDAKTCLATISGAMRGVKDSGQAIGAQALTELSALAPGALLHEGARLGSRQRLVNLVVTNVPGPQFPLHLGDRELLDIFPLVPLGTNLNLGVAIVSYNGTINFGLVSDFDNLPDVERVAQCFDVAVRELADVAGVQAEPVPAAAEDGDVRARVGLFSSTLEEPHVEAEEELVGSFAERGAEEGAGAEIEVSEPWAGYDEMTAADILDRLSAAAPAAAGMVELYERSHRGRKTVLAAAERALSTAGRP
jgi:diacylglycerol O-acyltransferase / wax synthase